MAIRNWHRGKLAILWAWTIVFILFMVQVLEPRQRAPDEPFALALGLGALALVIAAPLAMSVVTWIWLGDREQGD